MERRALTAPQPAQFAVYLIYRDQSSLPCFVQLAILGPNWGESQVFRNRFDHIEDKDRLAAELGGATDGQLGALGEEAAAVFVEEDLGATVVALGDAGMPRVDGRQDLDLIAIVEGELVAFEVKTTYRSKRAGRLTRAGNLRRPRMGSTNSGRRQAGQSYVIDRITGIVDTEDGYVGIRVQIIVIDLILMLAQVFDINDQGTRLSQPALRCPAVTR